MKLSKILNSLQKQKGQSFIEFILLFLILIILSLVMLKTTNTGVANRWTKLISVITSPDPDSLITPTLR